MTIQTFKENIIYKHSFFYEEKQTMQLRFCFLDEKENRTTNTTPWCLCRDFLNDTYLWTKYYNQIKPLNIYEYKHNPIEIHNLNLLGLKFPSKESYDNFITNFHIISKLEQFYNSKTYSQYKIITITEDTKIISIQIGEFWLRDTLKFSFFTLILRLFCSKPNLTNIWNNLTYNTDSTDSFFFLTFSKIYKNQYKFFIENLEHISNTDKILESFKIYKNNNYFWNYMHNKAGFLCYITCNIQIENFIPKTYNKDHPLYYIDIDVSSN